ncbi:diadenosine tetraphosphate (Ap4A) HIT family hydrolase [Bradyrhizobium sp. AZCC 1578]|uniref:hypothetical protein n=1 Tax=Bradyrhizobium sp. AZCC 1578 TaxID=3117027 RepID=UPI002FF0E69E
MKEVISVPWSASFEDPIPLPDGRRLLTLKEAASYITKLSKAEWQAAMKALILVAENGGHDAGPDRRHAGVEPSRRAGF